MERLTLPNGSLIAWQSAGDGFPLVLLPGPRGAAPWLPHMPLLGELCQAIAYESLQGQGQSGVELLPAVLDGLRLQRVYLASPVSRMAGDSLAFAGRRPECLEAVLFVEFPGAEGGAPPDAFPCPATGGGIPAGACPPGGGKTVPAGAAADLLAAHLPDCRRAVLGRPHRSLRPGCQAPRGDSLRT